MSSVCHSVKITHLTVLQNHMHIVHHRGTVPKLQASCTKTGGRGGLLGHACLAKVVTHGSLDLS